MFDDIVDDLQLLDGPADAVLAQVEVLGHAHHVGPRKGLKLKVLKCSY